jgi:hypothetical protein
MGISLSQIIEAWRPYGVLEIESDLDFQNAFRHKMPVMDTVNFPARILRGQYDCFVYKVTNQYVHNIIALFFLKTFKNGLLAIQGEFDCSILDNFKDFSFETYKLDDGIIISRICYNCKNAQEFYSKISSHRQVISCICPTYKRPSLLGDAIVTFLEQTYRNKRLYILNDDWGGAITLPFSCSIIQMQNHTERFMSIGDKLEYMRNWADGDIFVPWTDDDLYFPWRLQDTYDLHLKHEELVIKNSSALFQACGEILKVNNNLESTASYKREHYKKFRYMTDENLVAELNFIGKSPFLNFDLDPRFWLVMRWAGVNYHISGHGGTKEAYADYEKLICAYSNPVKLNSSDYIWHTIITENALKDESSKKAFALMGNWLKK